MTRLEINGKIVEVGDGFMDLSPEDQQRTVEEIAASMQPQGRGLLERTMNQVNMGVAQGVGGLVDLLNPFDQQMGAAREGMTQGMERMGSITSRDAPEGVWENMARGGGEAAGLAFPIAKGAQMAARAPGMIGSAANTVAQGMATRSAPVAEFAAGAASEGGREYARQEGAPQWVQETAAVAAPLGLAGAAAATGGAARAAARNSVIGRAGKAAARTLAPYTERGGMEVARTRMQDLAGGRERAEELAGRADGPQMEGIPRTPAQMTEDPNMMAVERLAASQDPALRARLDDQLQLGQRNARTMAAGEPGDTQATRDFIEQRRRAFRGRLQSQVQRAEETAQQRIRALGPNISESEASRIASNEIERGLQRAKAVDERLWDNVPRDVEVPTDTLRARAAEIEAGLPKSLKGNFPSVARAMLIDGGFNDAESIHEVHGFYSAMRKVQRDALVGPTPNRRLANVADQLAEAALLTMDKGDPAEEVGRRVRTAIAHTAEMHNAFSRGAVGTARKRTGDSEVAVEPETVLRRTIRPGPQGEVAARQIEDATDGQARDAVSSYVRGLFSDSITSADGRTTTASARQFLRNNSDLVGRYPELRQDIMDAVQRGEDATAMALRVERRISQANSNRDSATERFLNAPAGQEVTRALSSPNPARSTQILVNAARKDESGEALAGLKSAFANHLIERATSVTGGREVMDPKQMAGMLRDPNYSRAARIVLGSDELARLNRISRYLGQAAGEGVSAANIGPTLSNAEAPRVIQILAKVLGARIGADAGGGGGASIQTANIGSNRASELLQGLVADRASRIMADAVVDHDLFKALLTDANSPRFEREALPRLLPYLVGAGAASATDNQPQ